MYLPLLLPGGSRLQPQLADHRPVPHPAKGELALRRIPNRDVARGYGCTEHYVGRVLNGRIPPSPRFRAYVAALLELDEADLFRDQP